MLLKLKKKPFAKEQSSFYNRWSTDQYTISEIHNNVFPPVVSLEEYPNKKRRFYYFEVQRVSQDYLQPPTREESLLVTDILFKTEPVTRSGRILANKFKVLYQTEREGHKVVLDTSELKFHKRMWGEYSIVYSDTVLADPNKAKYIV